MIQVPTNGRLRHRSDADAGLRKRAGDGRTRLIRYCRTTVVALALLPFTNATRVSCAERPPIATADQFSRFASPEDDAVQANEQLQALDERAEQVLAEVNAPERKRSIAEIRQELDAIARERMQLRKRYREATGQQDRAIIDSLKSRSVLFSGVGATCGVMELLYPKFIGSLDPKVAATYPPKLWYAADSSESGFRDLLSGATEAAVLNRALTDDEQASLKKAFPDANRQPRQVTFCRAAVALVVPRSRRVRGMTIAQVEQVFRGTIEKWSAFGGIEQGIAPLGTKGPLLSWRIFTHHVLHDEVVRFPAFQYDPNHLPSADVLDAFYKEQRGRFPGGGPFPCYDTDDALLAAVAKKPNGIGYCLLFPSTEAMKHVGLVPIARNDGDEPVAPIEDGKLSEDYPLQEVISIVVHPDAPPSTKAFVEFATGPKAATVVKRCGLWPECELQEEKPESSAEPTKSKAG
jgi:ABC-type phosphate transport system substrate-binding protein